MGKQSNEIFRQMLRHILFLKDAQLFVLDFRSFQSGLKSQIFSFYSKKSSKNVSKNNSFVQYHNISIKSSLLLSHNPPSINQLKISLSQPSLQILIQIQQFIELMLKAAVFTTIIFLATSQTPLLLSRPELVTILHPPGWSPSLYMYASPKLTEQNKALQIWVNGTQQPPGGFKAIFQALFYSSCSQIATLSITADDDHIAYLNDNMVSKGVFGRQYVTQVYPECGLNNFTIVVVNGGGPANVYFTIKQDQNNCFKCGSSAFYNYSCDDKRQIWADYPLCGCVCSNKAFTACNRKNQYFDEKNCKCKCLNVICPTNLQQDPQSCQCRCKAKQCPSGQSWNYSKCACTKKQCKLMNACKLPKVLNRQSCECQCPSKLDCPVSMEYDKKSCSCVSLNSQQNNN